MFRNKTFIEIVNMYFPNRAIRVKAGDTELYLGKNCDGLKEMNPEAIKYLDNHQIMGFALNEKEITLKYRKSKTFEKIIWG